MFEVTITKQNKSHHFMDADYFTEITLNGEYYKSFYTHTLWGAHREAKRLIDNYKPAEVMYKHAIVKEL